MEDNDTARGGEDDYEKRGGTNKRRLQVLLSMLRTAPSQNSDDILVVGLKGEKLMVFLNSVDDVFRSFSAIGGRVGRRRPRCWCVPISLRVDLAYRV